MIKENQRNHWIDFEACIDLMPQIKVQVFEVLASIYIEDVSSIFS